MRGGRERGGKRLLPLWRPGRTEAVERELAHHVAELADRLESEGLSRIEAEREARRRMGDGAALRARLLEAAAPERRRVGDWMASLRADVSVSARSLLRRRGYAATLALTLGLGVAVVTALFAIVDALLLRPLPYRNAGALVSVELLLEDGGTLGSMPLRQLMGWGESADFMAAIESYQEMSVVRSDGAEPEYVNALAVTAGLDDLLGGGVRAGRTFTAADVLPGATEVAIVTHGYWRRMGSPPDIVGRALRLEGRPFTVVGVLAAEFKFPVQGTQDLWIPLHTDWQAAGRTLRQVSVVGLPGAGIGLGEARARSDRLGAALQEAQPTRLGWTAALVPVTDWRSSPVVRRALWLLAGATSVLLVLALVNCANLTLVRSWSRNHEMGMRRALGASRAALHRLVFAETAVLAVAAALVAVAGARVLVLLLRSVLPAEVVGRSVYAFEIGPRVLGFAFLVALVAGLALGLVSGIAAMRAAPLAERDVTPRRLRARKALIVAEVGLTVLLISGAAAFGRGFLHLLGTDPGYQPERVARVTVYLPPARYPDAAGMWAFVDAALLRLGRVPGVQAVTTGSLPPRVSRSDGGRIAAEDRPPLEEQPALFAIVEGGEGYLDVMGIRLLAGRALDARDVEAAGRGVRNVLIDDELARALWDGGSAIGRRFQLEEGGRIWYTVVGLFRRVRFMGPDDRSAPHGLIQARPRSIPPIPSFLVRAAGDPAALLPALASAIRDVDPGLAIRELETGSQALGEVLETPRLMVAVLGTLAAAAAVLVAVGLFGVLTYAVSRRARELGIRIALGAPRPAVRGHLLGEGLALGATGAALGIALSFWLARYARALLYEVSPVDPLVLGGVALFTLLLALLAALVPACRASRVDPVTVLRSD